MRTASDPGVRYDEANARRRQRRSQQSTKQTNGEQPDIAAFTVRVCGELSDKAAFAGVIINDEAEIERLARMRRLEYERERLGAAKRLGIHRIAVLDAEVLAMRKKLGLVDDDDDDGKQGKPIIFNEPDMWPEPVSGEVLLDEIAEAIRTYVTMAELSCYAVTLWIVFTYLIHLFMISPRLAIRSPTHRCGKSTLIDVLAHLVSRQLRCDNISAPALTRVIAAFRPCMLIDEVDSFAAGEEALFGIIKSGHRRDHPAIKLVGDEFEARAFDLFSALAIAFIGSVPAPLTDRSVITDLRRRKKGETVTRFRSDQTKHLDQLARKIARWVHDHANEVGACDPPIPDEVFNRDADNWRPLISIADVVGGEKWPQRARQAAKASVKSADDDSSIVEMLIRDIASILDEEGEADRIGSEALAAALHEREGRPWKEYGKQQKPITPNQIARLLKGVRDANGVPIGPVQIKVRNPDYDRDAPPDNPDSTRVIQVRGYRRDQFQDAFERYLETPSAENPDSNRQTVTEPSATGTSGPFQTVTSTPSGDTSKRAGNPHGAKAGDGLTVENPENQSAASVSLSQPQIRQLAKDLKEYAYLHRADPRIDQKLRQVVDEWLVNRYGVEAADLDAEAARVLDLMYLV